MVNRQKWIVSFAINVLPSILHLVSFIDAELMTLIARSLSLLLWQLVQLLILNISTLITIVRQKNKIKEDHQYCPTKVHMTTAFESMKGTSLQDTCKAIYMLAVDQTAAATQ